MDDHIYKLIEITGTSATSSDDAVRSAIEKAGQTVREMRWFKITEVRGEIRSATVAHWQVTLKIGFRVD